MVYGVPETVEKTELESLIGQIQRGVASVQELKLNKDQVTVFFPKDLVPAGLGEEIIIFIKGLIGYSERTPAVKRKLRKSVLGIIGKFASNNIKNCNYMEAFTETIDVDDFDFEKLPQ